MIRNVLVTSTPIMFGAAAVVVKKADEPAAALVHYQCKPSELPLYAPLHSLNAPKPPPHPVKVSPARQSIECGIRAVRVEVCNGVNVISAQKKSFEDFIDTGKAHTQTAVDYLNEPANTFPRLGAIAIGGLSGTIFALRGGFFKKLLYTSIGAGGIASLCYPKEAEQYAQLSLVEAKKGFAIAYNFAFGIKPEDNVKPDAVSKFPTSIVEVQELTLDFVNSAKEALFSKKK